MISREAYRNYLSPSNHPEKVIDVHTHSGADNLNLLFRRYPTTQSIKDLVSKLKLTNVDMAVNFTCPSAYYYFDFPKLVDGVQFVNRPAEDFPYQLANRQLFYETSLFGEDKIIPFPVVFPGLEDNKQIAYLSELAKQDKLFGIKLHTLATHTKATAFIDSKYLQIAEDNSVPFLIHTGPDDYSLPEHVLTLAKMYPHIRFCIAHVGRFEKSVFEEAASSKYDNLYFDTSPIISLCKIVQRDIQRGVGGEKLAINFDNPREVLLYLYGNNPNAIIWGTDEPWTTITDDSENGIVAKVDYSDEKALFDSLPAKVRKQIGYQNTTRFLFGRE